MIFGDPARFRLPLVPMSEGGRAKLAAAAFYATQIMPRASGLKRMILDGAVVVAGLDTAVL